jgi:hypothetical protein
MGGLGDSDTDAPGVLEEIVELSGGPEEFLIVDF